MDRIETLMKQLQEAYEAKADAVRLLGIVQLLQFELSAKNETTKNTLGTAKVAVVLPVAPSPVQHAPGFAAAKTAEKHAPSKDPEPQRVKETILVEEGSFSVLQKNGQLDMVFDPKTEIPTLSSQHPGKEIPETDRAPESVNDRLKQTKSELVEVLKETPVKDLRKAVGINDRFLFINELFRGDEDMYERCIRTINNFNIYPEAEYWISRELKVKLAWDDDRPVVQQFYQLVKRRFT